jgi:hypothetical protein
LEKCGFCGFENSDNMHFCRKCGKPLSTIKARKDGKKAKSALKSPTKKRVAKAAIALAALAAIVVALYFLDSRNVIKIGKFTFKEGIATFTGGSESPAVPAGNADESDPDGESESAGDSEPADESAQPEDSTGEAGEAGDKSAESESAYGDSGTGSENQAAESLALARVFQSDGDSEGKSFGDLFEILQLEEVSEQDGRYLSVAMRNKSADDFSPIKLEFEFYDRDGAVVGRESAENDNFFAYNAWMFKIKLEAESAQSFSVSAVELNGRRNAVSQ